MVGRDLGATGLDGMDRRIPVAGVLLDHVPI